MLYSISLRRLGMEHPRRLPLPDATESLTPISPAIVGGNFPSVVHSWIWAVVFRRSQRLRLPRNCQRGTSSALIQRFLTLSCTMNRVIMPPLTKPVTCCTFKATVHASAHSPKIQQEQRHTSASSFACLWINRRRQGLTR